MTESKQPAEKPAPRKPGRPKSPPKPQTPKAKPGSRKYAKAGMPTTYSIETARMLCDYMMTPMSFSQACRQPGMPSRGLACRWLIAHEEFRLMYAEAKAVSMDLYVDETIDIADEVDEDNAAISKAKLRIDSRWKSAERVASKKYGPKTDQTIALVPHESWLEQLQ